MVQLIILLFLLSLLQTASQILSSPVLNHALLFVNKSSADFEEISSAFSIAAEEFRMKVCRTQTPRLSSLSSTENAFIFVTIKVTHAVNHFL